MKVTFLSHSAFLVETPVKYLLFDYQKGTLPKLDPEKPLYIFVSHKHQDHFNPVIFQFAQRYKKVQYILSYDIKLKPRNWEKWILGEDWEETACALTDRILSVRADTNYSIGDMELTTLKSTDEGVAFLIRTEDKTIYHAGDLNWWYWAEEDKQWNNNMTADFKRQADKLTNMSVDLAFLPLDPRQEQHYYLGFEYMLKTARVKTAFPMHMWGDFSIMNRFRKEGHANLYDTNIINVEKEGQVWDII